METIVSGASARGGEEVIDTTTADFASDVIEASREKPVLVDFWAEWCGPCKQLAPVLERVVKASGGKVRLVKMNIDQHPEIAGQMGIRSIPAVVAFKDGKPVDAFMGAVPESQVTAFIEKVAGPIGNSQVDGLLEAAGAALAAQKWSEAAEAYAAVLGRESGNLAAIGGLARCYVASGDLARAEETLALVPETKKNDPAIAGARAELELARQSAELGTPEELRARLDADPDDHQARFDLALALNARGDRDGAAQALLEIVRRDREWNDDGARKQLLQFFEAWGGGDPATVAARRALSSVLFS